MKNILIIAVCGLMYSSLTAMHLPQDVILVQSQPQTEALQLNADFCISQVDFVVNIPAMENPKVFVEMSKPTTYVVAVTALHDMSHFYKPVIYEQYSLKKSNRQTKTSSFQTKNLSQTIVPLVDCNSWRWCLIS